MAVLIFEFKKNFLQILQWRSANAVIDGRTTIKVPWNKNIEFNVGEGHHAIQISIPYLGSEIGKSKIEFQIKKGEKFFITYKPPLTVLTEGTILIDKE